MRKQEKFIHRLLATVLTSFLTLVATGALIFGLLKWNFKYNETFLTEAYTPIIGFMGNIMMQDLYRMYQKSFPEINIKSPTEAWNHFVCDDPAMNVKLFESHGLKIEVENLDRVPTQGGLIVIANHRTALDTPILISILSKLRNNVKSVRTIQPYVDTSKAHPSKLHIIDLSGKIISGGYEKINQTLSDNGTIIIFPQPIATSKDVKTGVLKIALENKVPILLVKLEFRDKWWTPLMNVFPSGMRDVLMMVAMWRCKNTLFKVKFGSTKSVKELQELTKEGLIEVNGVKKYNPEIVKTFMRQINSI